MSEFNTHPEVTDDQVQNAVDDADGKHDGDIVSQPESDVQAALALYERSEKGALDKLELFGLSCKAVFTKGERHVLNEDWAQLGVVLGPALVDIIKRVVSLV